MNRLGMMIDLAHVSAGCMRAVLEITQSPVLFSHSNAQKVCDHPRNVPVNTPMQALCKLLRPADGSSTAHVVPTVPRCPLALLSMFRTPVCPPDANVPRRLRTTCWTW